MSAPEVAADTAEGLYLDMYKVAAEEGDAFLQPEDEHVHAWLPEVSVAILASTLLLPILYGFLESAGADLYEKVKEVVVGGKKLKQCDAKELVSFMTENLPALRQQRHRIAEVEKTVYQELVESGFTEDGSDVLTRRAIEVVLKRLDDA